MRCHYIFISSPLIYILYISLTRQANLIFTDPFCISYIRPTSTPHLQLRIWGNGNFFQLRKYSDSSSHKKKRHGILTTSSFLLPFVFTPLFSMAKPLLIYNLILQLQLTLLISVCHYYHLGSIAFYSHLHFYSFCSYSLSFVFIAMFYVRYICLELFLNYCSLLLELYF